LLFVGWIISFSWFSKELGSINQVISFWNFHLLIPKQFLEFAAYKTRLLFHSNFVQNISVASTTKKKDKSKKKSFKKTFIGLCCRKLN
jgi:hypothetical protein